MADDGTLLAFGPSRRVNKYLWCLEVDSVNIITLFWVVLYEINSFVSFCRLLMISLTEGNNLSEFIVGVDVNIRYGIYAIILL